MFLQVFSYCVFNAWHIIILHDYGLNLSAQLKDIGNNY